MKRTRGEHGILTKTCCSGTLDFQICGGIDDFAVKQLSSQEDLTFDQGADSIDFVIYFRPPVTRAHAEQAHVSIHYVGLQETPNKHIFGQYALPAPPTGGERLVLRQDELEYEIFETHQLRVSSKGALIDSMYVTIENNLTESKTRNDLLLHPHVDMKLDFFTTHLGEHACFLDWFPADIDPKLYGLEIDSRKIPQRTPLWFKLRGEVSGSKAYSLIGFFIPAKHTKDGTNYNFYKGSAFTATAKLAMRLGTLSEDSCMLMYLCEYPEKRFFELGWCPAPTGYPVGWGASPDGLIEDKNMDWSMVPDDIKAHYPDAQRSAFNITMGACEFKTSKTKLSMEAYYFPQVYMEMIALNVVWCDLVRYRPSRSYNQLTKEWITDSTAHVYRIYRHKPTEEALVKLWSRASANTQKIQDIVMEESFVKMRDYFSDLAQRMPVHHVLAMKPSTQTLLAQYEAKRQQLMQPVPPPLSLLKRGAGAEAEDWIDELDHGVQKLKRAKHDKPMAVRLLAHHIAQCASFISKLV